MPEGKRLRPICVRFVNEKFLASMGKHLKNYKTPRLRVRCYWYHGLWGLLPLIVWDYVRYAREHDILVGPGRGSAAGSVVAYLLGITGLDPIKIRFALWTVLKSRAGKHARYRYWLLLWKTWSSYRICNAKNTDRSVYPRLLPLVLRQRAP